MKIIEYTNIQNNKHDIYVFLSRFDIFYTGKLFSHSCLFGRACTEWGSRQGVNFNLKRKEQNIFPAVDE